MRPSPADSFTRVVNGRYDSPDVFAPLSNGFCHSFGLFYTRWKSRCNLDGPFDTLANEPLELSDAFPTRLKALSDLHGPLNSVEKTFHDCAKPFQPRERTSADRRGLSNPGEKVRLKGNHPFTRHSQSPLKLNHPFPTLAE